MDKQRSTSKDQSKRFTRGGHRRRPPALAISIAVLLVGLGAAALVQAAPPPSPALKVGSPAGGALKGTYPNPLLNISGGPCSDREAVRDVSSLAALTCGPGVYAAGSNTAVGDTALENNTEGDELSAFGHDALQFNTTGRANAAVGTYALQHNSSGQNNAALGAEALESNTTGSGNAAVGGSALQANTEGSSNVAMGSGALQASTGSNNTALGGGAGTNLTDGSNNIDIGNPGNAGESSTIRIGRPFGGKSQNRTFIAGIRGTTVGSDALPVVIDSSGQLGTASAAPIALLRNQLDEQWRQNQALQVQVRRQQAEIDWLMHYVQGR